MEEGRNRSHPEEREAAHRNRELPPHQPAQLHRQTGGATRSTQTATLGGRQGQNQPKPGRLPPRAFNHRPAHQSNAGDLRLLRGSEAPESGTSPPRLRQSVRPRLESGTVRKDGENGNPRLCHEMDRRPTPRQTSKSALGRGPLQLAGLPRGTAPGKRPRAPTLAHIH